MTEEKRRNKEIVGAIGAFFFISPNLNILESMLSYCGIESHDTVRLISVAFFALLDVLLAYLFFISRPDKRMYGVLIAFNVIYYSPLLFNWDTTIIMQYIVLILPVTVIAVLLSADKEVRDSFYKYLRIGAGILMIGALIYILLQYVSTNRDKDGVLIIKNMTYGDMGYLFLTGFVVSAIECMERKTVIGYFGIIVFSLAVFFSGSRSAILCIVFTIVMWGFLMLLKAPKEKRIKSLIVIAATLVTISAGMFFVPEGSRLNFFHFDVTASNFSLKDLLFEINAENKNDFPVIYTPTGEERMISDIYEEEIVENDVKKSETEGRLRDDVKSNKNEYIKLINEDDREKAEKYMMIFHRTFLWRTAIQEFKKHPLIGNGPCYYKTKYDGFFPHNILLEAMTDFGIVGLAVVVGLGIYIIVRGIKLYLREDDENYFRLILLLFSHIPRYMLYSSIYSNYTIALTVIIFIAIGRLGEKSISGIADRCEMSESN